MAIAISISSNDVPRIAGDDIPSTLEKKWALDSACPPDVPTASLKQHLLSLQSLIAVDATTAAGDFNASAYWPPVSRQLHAVRTECEPLQSNIDRCKPWVKIVISKLLYGIDMCFRFYKADEVEGPSCSRPYPLHEQTCRIFDRIIFALADLPKIELWRPIESSKRSPSSRDLDELTTRTVAKVFEEYLDDNDLLTWGTLNELEQACDQLLELRRDHGDFLPWSPPRVHEIRLLADRLGCDEPPIPFEDECCRAAFSRRMSDSEGRTWSIDTDHQVRSWLKRILSWCEDLASRIVTIDQDAEPKFPPVGIAECAPAEMVTVVAPILASPTTSAPAVVRRPKYRVPSARVSDGPTAGQQQRSHTHQSGNRFDTPRKPKTKLSWDTANERAKALLKKDPGFADASLRVWAELIGCATGSVCKLPLWKKIQARKVALAADRSVTTTSLSPDVLDAICAGSDEAIKQLTREQESDLKNDERMARQTARSRSS